MKILALLSFFLIAKISAFLPASHAYFAEIYFQAYVVKDQVKQAEFMFGIMSHWLVCKDDLPDFFSREVITESDVSIEYLRAADQANDYFEKGKLYHEYLVNKLSWAESNFANQERINKYLTDNHEAFLYLLDEIFSSVRTKMLTHYRLQDCHKKNLAGWGGVNYTNLHALVEYLMILPKDHLHTLAWKEEQINLKKSEYYRDLLIGVEKGLRNTYILEFAHYFYEEYCKDIIQMMYDSEPK